MMRIFDQRMRSRRPRYPAMENTRGRAVLRKMSFRGKVTTDASPKSGFRERVGQLAKDGTWECLCPNQMIRCRVQPANLARAATQRSNRLQLLKLPKW